MKNFEEFQKLDNKFEVFQSFESLTKYVEKVIDFIELFKYLTDEEKYAVIQKDYYLRQNDSLKNQTLETIESDDIKCQMMSGEIADVLCTIEDDDYKEEQLVRLLFD